MQYSVFEGSAPCPSHWSYALVSFGIHEVTRGIGNTTLDSDMLDALFVYIVDIFIRNTVAQFAFLMSPIYQMLRASALFSSKS
jgi:hypothetical protein